MGKAIDQEKTRAEVFAAADALKARGVKPSVVTIRDERGKGGSYGTIQPFLDEWREADAKRVPEPVAAIPEAVTQAMQVALHQIWAAADGAGRREVTAAKEAAALRVAEATADLGEAREEISRLERELVERDGEARRQRERAEEAERKLAATVALETELRGRLSTQEDRSRELEGKVHALSASHEETERQLVDSIRQAEALRAKDEEVTSELVRAKAETIEERRRTETALKAEEESRAEMAVARDASAAALARLSAQETAAAVAAATVAELRERLQVEATRNQTLDERVAALVKDLGRLASART